VKYLVPLALALCLITPAEASTKPYQASGKVNQKPVHQTGRAYHPKPYKLKAIKTPRTRAAQHAQPKRHGPAKQVRAHKPKLSR